MPRKPPMPSPKRRLGSIAAAAGQLDVCERTVREYISTGMLTAYRVGPRLVKVDLAEVDALPQPIPTATRPRAGAA